MNSGGLRGAEQLDACPLRFRVSGGGGQGVVVFSGLEEEKDSYYMREDSETSPGNQAGGSVQL